MSYLQLFLQSTAIEILFLLIFFRGIPASRVAKISFLANAFTHPLFVFGWLAIPGQRTLPWLLSGEALVILAEAVIFFYCLRKRFGITLAGALIANLLSWELGPRLSFWMMRQGWFL